MSEKFLPYAILALTCVLAITTLITGKMRIPGSGIAIERKSDPLAFWTYWAFTFLALGVSACIMLILSGHI